MRLWRQRLRQSRRRAAVSVALTVSSPAVTRDESRFSSSASDVTPAAFCPTNALRSNTLRPTPKSISPQFSPVIPATGWALSVSYARNSPIGVRPLPVRSMVIFLLCHSSSMRPSIGAPLHGLYFVFAGSVPALARWLVSTP